MLGKCEPEIYQRQSAFIGGSPHPAFCFHRISARQVSAVELNSFQHLISKKDLFYAKAQTRQSGSLGHRAGLHEHELRLRPGGRQAGDDFPDPVGGRAGRHVLRHRRGLWPVHE